MRQVPATAIRPGDRVRIPSHTSTIRVVAVDGGESETTLSLKVEHPGPRSILSVSRSQHVALIAREVAIPPRGPAPVPLDALLTQAILAGCEAFFAAVSACASETARDDRVSARAYLEAERAAAAWIDSNIIRADEKTDVLVYVPISRAESQSTLLAVHARRIRVSEDAVVPSFSQDQADLLVRALTLVVGRQGPRFITPTGIGFTTLTPFAEAFESWNPDERGLYSIGAGRWPWRIAQANLPIYLATEVVAAGHG